MNPLFITSIVFASLFAAALLGLYLQRILPDHHLAPETRDSVRIGMGSVATMAALLLGLLVASAKSAYDTEKGEVIQMSSKIVYLDKLLENFGPESAEVQHILKKTLKISIETVWPEQGTSENLPDPSAAWTKSIPLSIQNLEAKNEAQRTFKSQAATLANELGQMRWLLYTQTESSISVTLLATTIAWLALTFVSVGLFAPANFTSILAQFMAALAISGAIFLILELDQPFDGIIKISPKTMINAYQHLD